MIHAVYGAVAVVAAILCFVAGHYTAWCERDKRDLVRRERGGIQND